MPEIAEKVKTNIKERVGAITVIGDSFSEATKMLIDHLRKVEPVQGIAAFSTKFGDGSMLFVKKQAEITRRWVG